MVSSVFLTNLLLHAHRSEHGLMACPSPFFAPFCINPTLSFLSMRVKGHVGGYISVLPQKTLDDMQIALPSLSD